MGRNSQELRVQGECYVQHERSSQYCLLLVEACCHAVCVLIIPGPIICIVQSLHSLYVFDESEIG